MEESCNEFKTDMEQFGNLYSLILREIAGRSSKKAYKELYNSTYLLGIEETEKNFNQEVNTIKSKAGLGAIINTNYWRIEGIKSIYENFNQEVEESYGRDLSEFMPEEKIDVNQYRSILQAIFTENNNILSSLDSPNRSNLHRMIRIYDFLEYGQKKTP